MTTHAIIRAEISNIIGALHSLPDDDAPIVGCRGHHGRFDSLERIALIMALEQRFGIDLPDEAPPDPLTINSLASVIDHIQAVDERDWLQLKYAIGEAEMKREGL